MAETKKTAEKEETTEKKVKVIIPKIPGRKDQPDVVLGFSGRNIQIKRGVEVEIPAIYAEILKEHEEAVEVYESYLYGKAE